MNFSHRARVDLAVLGLVLGSVGAFVVCMIVQSVTWETAIPISRAVTGIYWIAFAMAWFWVGVAVWRWRVDGGASLNSMVWHPATFILLVAVVVRLVLVLGSEPHLSDDIWRYIHDGQTLAGGANPYAAAPLEVVPVDPSHAQLLARINHPSLVTIYQPLSQYVFAGLSWLKLGEWDPWGDRTFRLGFVAFDVGIVLLLLQGLSVQGRSLWWAILYAWHPLVISEVGGSGHQDVIGVVFLIIGLLLATHTQRAQDRWSDHAWRTACFAGASLGLAILVKPFVLPLVLVIVWITWRNNRWCFLSALGSMFAVIVLFFAPFLLMDGGIGGMVETAKIFVDKWSYNSSIHHLVQLMLGSRQCADWTAALVLLVLLGVGVYRRWNLWTLSATFLLGALLLSSTAHPWYLLWVLAVIPLLGPELSREVAAPMDLSWASMIRAAAWMFSLTISWSYVSHLRKEFQLPMWIGLVEYVPVYAVFVVYGVCHWVRGRGSLVYSSGPDQ